MSEDLDIGVLFDIPGGPPPPWLQDIAQIDQNWTRQTSQFVGADWPEQQPPPPVHTYAVEVPMSFLPPKPGEVEQPKELTQQAQEQPAVQTTEVPATETVSPEIPQVPVVPETPQLVGSEEGPSGEEAAPSGGEEGPSGGEVGGENPPTAEESLPEGQEEVSTPTPPESTEGEEAQPGQANQLPYPPLLEPIIPEYPDLLDPAWVAGIAYTGSILYTFWDGYQKDRGLDFGYDETDGDGSPIKEDGSPADGSSGRSGVNSLIGTNVLQSLYVGPFGCDPAGIGPASFGAVGSGDVSVDLTSNNQNLVTGEDPLSYKPNRNGSGPGVFPLNNGCAALAVVTMSALDSEGIIPQLPNVSWWMITQKVHFSVAGFLCAGVIPAGVSTLVFNCPNEISVSVVAFPNCPGSVIPKQFITFEGSIDTNSNDSDTPKKISMSIAPTKPYPWPASQRSLVFMNAEPEVSSA